MSKWSRTWIGMAGGGFGASAIVGGGVYGITLWNMGGAKTPIQALIVGKRLGLTLQAEAAHAVCFLTGVSGPNDFNTLSSSGVDWAISLGANLKNIIKSGGQALELVGKLAKKSADASWATNEAAKKAAQFASGDLSLDFDKKNFYLLPTPASVGIGAGIWYEWQTLYKTGTDLAWRYAEPRWSIKQKQKQVLFRMCNIPEPDGAEITFVVRTNNWGIDNLIDWDHKGYRPRDGFGIRVSDARIYGRVYSGWLYPSGSRGSGHDGINLTALKPKGRTDIGMLTVSHNKTVEKNTKFGIGPTVKRGALDRWVADDYAKVETDGEGRLVKVVGKEKWYE